MRSKLYNFMLSIMCGVGVTVIVYALFVTVSDDKVFNDSYCVNVAIWESDADAGINPYDRAGHPNYKEINCEQ